MKIKRFYIVEPQSYDIETGKFSITFHEYGEIKKNVIFWKKLDPKDKLYKKYLKIDFKDFITKDFKFNFTK